MKSVAILLLVFLNADHVSGVRTSVMFSKTNPCNIPSAFSVMNSSDVGSCTYYCLSSQDCEAFSFSKQDDECLLHDTPLPDDGCPQSSMHFIKEPPTCLNGGNYDLTSHTCVCKDSFVGERCERLMEDCSEGFQYAYYTTNKVYTIHPHLSPTSFDVYCQMSWGGRTYIQHRNSKKKAFEMGWNEYKNGFGSIDNSPGDFWLGNDKIYYITNGRRHKLLMQIYNQGKYWQLYFLGFKIGNESEKFKLMFDGLQNAANPERILGDCLTPLLNASFSTNDRDNDEDSDVDCGALHKSGWWFRGPDCAVCNPNGYMTSNAERPGQPQDAFWTPTLGNKAINKMYMSLVRSDE